METRREIHDLIDEKRRTKRQLMMDIQRLKTDIIELERKSMLLSDKEQWFTECKEIVTEREGGKKNKVERLIGRVHWHENFKDEYTGEVITVERNQVVRIDGNWKW